MTRPCPHCQAPVAAHLGRDHLGAYLVIACPLCGCSIELLPVGAHDRPQPRTIPQTSEGAAAP